MIHASRDNGAGGPVILCQPTHKKPEVGPPYLQYVVVNSAMDPHILQVTCPECLAIISAELAQG